MSTMITERKVCPICGTGHFTILESKGWNAFIDDAGQIQAHRKANEIEDIICKQCNTALGADFFGNQEINFN